MRSGFISRLRGLGALILYRILNIWVVRIAKLLGLRFSFQLRMTPSSADSLFLLKAKNFLLYRHLWTTEFSSTTGYVHSFSQKVCVVIQGSTVGNMNAINSNLSRITRNYPSVQIVLATWENEDTSELIKLDNLIVLKSKVPSHAGIANINLQITSTLLGLRFAEIGGIEFTAKIRTDQEFLNPFWLTNLMQKYAEFCGSDSYRKIIVSSLNTLCFRKYSISDMMTFGRTEDLLRFWDAPLDLRESGDLDGFQLSNFDSWSRARLAEVYICSNYLELLGVELEFTLEHYYQILWKYFVVMDGGDLGQVWGKYTNLSPAVPSNCFPSQWSEIDFSMWRSLSTFQNELAAIGRRINCI